MSFDFPFVRLFRERDTDTDNLEDRIDSIEKSAKVERVKIVTKRK
jgi:hypothetical protein